MMMMIVTTSGKILPNAILQVRLSRLKAKHATRVPLMMIIDSPIIGVARPRDSFSL